MIDLNKEIEARIARQERLYGGFFAMAHGMNVTEVRQALDKIGRDLDGKSFVDGFVKPGDADCTQAPVPVGDKKPAPAPPHIVY